MSKYRLDTFVSQKTTVNGVPVTVAGLDWEWKMGAAYATDVVGDGCSLRDATGKIFDVPLRVKHAQRDVVHGSFRRFFSVEPGTPEHQVYLDYVSTYPYKAINVPPGTYDIRFSIWEESVLPVKTRLIDSGWIPAAVVVEFYAPETPIVEEPPTELPPTEEPTVTPSLLETLATSIKTLLTSQIQLAPITLAHLLGSYFSRAVTDADLEKITAKTADFMPSLNFVSKATMGLDLSTNEKASIADITEDEMISAILDATLIVTGAKLLGTGFIALNEGRAATTLAKVISSPAKLTASGQRYATYLRRSSPLAEKLIVGSTVLRPTFSTGILARLASSIRLNPYPMLIVGIIALSQMDVIGWGFDSLPKQIRDRQKDRYKTVQSLMFDLQDNLDAGNYIGARAIALSMRDLLEEIEIDLASRTPQFWQHRGTSYDDILAVVRGYRSALDALNDIYPQLNVDFDLSPVPEELHGTVTNVHDGDTFTLTADGAPRPTYTIRMLMIDTHESGTDAGVIEGDKLEELILNKPVIVLVDPYNQRGRYGRVLGMTVIETSAGLQNINLDMLNTFGTDILTDTKYHTKNKYVDWDEALTIAKTAPVEAPAFKKPTITTIKRQFIHGYIQLDEARREVAALGYSQEDQDDLIAEFVDARGKEEATEIPTPPPAEVVPPVEAPTEATGAIKVYSKPAYANIYLDGKYTYKLAIETFKNLSPGIHTIRLEIEGYDPLEVDVDVKAGVTHEVRGELKKVVY